MSTPPDAPPSPLAHDSESDRECDNESGRESGRSSQKQGRRASFAALGSSIMQSGSMMLLDVTGNGERGDVSGREPSGRDRAGSDASAGGVSSMGSRKMDIAFHDIEVNQPLSILNYTWRTNVGAVLTAIPGVLMIYASYLGIQAIGGDEIAACNNITMIMMEITMIAVKGDKAYVRRTLLGHWPVRIITYLIGSYLMNWNASAIHYTLPILLNGTAYSTGVFATYFFLPNTKELPRDSLGLHSFKSFTMGVIHVVHMAVIFGHIIPTRLLAKHYAPIYTALVTGVFFPAITFIARKSLIMIATRDMNSAANAGEVNSFVEAYTQMMKIVAILMLLTPAVLMFLNVSVGWAALAAMSQAISEVALKVLVAKALKVEFQMKKKAKELIIKGTKARLSFSNKKAVAPTEEEEDDVDSLPEPSGRLSATGVRNGFIAAKGAVRHAAHDMKGAVKERGAHMLVEPGLMDDAHPDDASFVDEKGLGDLSELSEEEMMEKQLTRALALLAIRWHGEILGEKACLLCAGVVAVLFFGESVSASPRELAVMAAVFFGIEGVVDFAFVWLVDRYAKVPILSVVVPQPLCSLKNLGEDIMLGLCFAGTTMCIVCCVLVPL